MSVLVSKSIHQDTRNCWRLNVLMVVLVLSRQGSSDGSLKVYKTKTTNRQGVGSFGVLTVGD